MTKALFFCWIAGTIHGIWPYLDKWAGLPFKFSTGLIALGMATLAVPIMLFENATWTLPRAGASYIAGMMGCMGVLFFLSGMGIARTISAEKESAAFITMLLSQLAVPALVALATAGFSTTRVLGLIAAALAVWLLTR